MNITASVGELKTAYKVLHFFENSKLNSNKAFKLCQEVFNDSINDTVIKLCVSQVPEILEFVTQTPELCLIALDSCWSESVYGIIDIPFEGDFLKEINKMKLLKGSLHQDVFVDIETGERYCYFNDKFDKLK